MQDEILSINPNSETRTGQGLDPYVMRLPDGHIRVTADSIVFPETCPRCETAPASVGVRLSGGRKGTRSIKIPYCKPCGWALNLVQYAFMGLMIIGVMVVFPRLKLPNSGWLAKYPSSVVLIAIFFVAGWLFEQAFNVFFKPRVAVAAATKESIDLSFEDQMYAEKFVELNR